MKKKNKEELYGKILYKFLKRKGILYNFIENYLADRHESLKKLKKEKIIGILNKCPISGAFLWRSTKEGDSFWYKINSDFYRYYDKFECF